MTVQPGLVSADTMRSTSPLLSSVTVPTPSTSNTEEAEGTDEMVSLVGGTGDGNVVSDTEVAMVVGGNVSTAVISLMVSGRGVGFPSTCVFTSAAAEPATSTPVRESSVVTRIFLMPRSSYVITDRSDTAERPRNVQIAHSVRRDLSQRQRSASERDRMQP